MLIFIASTQQRWHSSSSAKRHTQDVNARCAALATAAPLMLFMKGSPDAPKCGFSRKVVEALKEAGAEFGHAPVAHTSTRSHLHAPRRHPTAPRPSPVCALLSVRRHFDILTDEAVRQGMKAFANWPTFPQLYAQGELVGGCALTELNRAQPSRGRGRNEQSELSVRPCVMSGACVFVAAQGVTSFSSSKRRESSSRLSTRRW